MEISTNLGRVSLVPRGEYDPAAQYERLDVVRYQGAGYLALRTVRGVTPEDGADYMLLAERGGQGDPGIQGPEGPAGPAGADGTSFTVRGRYDTLAELAAAHPTGTAGDAYAVGSAESSTIYLWSADLMEWQGAGPLQGPEGPRGQGVPDGGTIGQVLGKTGSGDYDTGWVDALQFSGDASLFGSGPYTLQAVKNEPAGWDGLSVSASSRWLSIIYGKGKFFVSSNDLKAKAVYSTDGINWTEAEIPFAFHKTAYGNGIFVAVNTNFANNNLAYSTDGITWETATMPVGSLSCLDYVNGKFLALGRGKGAYSTDGVNWEEITLPSNGLQSCAYGNGKFVAIGSLGAAYSTDGINWTGTTLPFSSNWPCVTYGNGKFIAMSYQYTSEIAYSTDGITWETATMPVGDFWRHATYANGKFVAISGSNISLSDKAAYSTDGINWTIMTMPAVTQWTYSAYGNGKFVAVSYNNDNNYKNNIAILPDFNPYSIKINDITII